MANARQIVIDIVGDSTKYTKATTEAITATVKLEKSMGELKKGLIEGLGLAGGLGIANAVSSVVSGVVDKVGQSIQLASDKAEAASKANVLFGDSYRIVEQASRSAATTVGLSSGAYLTAAGNLGNLITNFGIVGDEAAAMSVDMLQLASDMGSFNNASTEEVTEAMGAAFRGETEPIRRFGVMLSAADVAARAVAMGLAASTKAVSTEAKARATYSLILQQTTKAQGDFARTSDGLANSERINAAKMEESMTRLGEAITPLYMTIMPLLADGTRAVIDVLTNLASFVAPLVDGGLRIIGDTIEDLGEAFHQLQRLLDPASAEWDELTRAIHQQAEALGLSGEAVIAFVAAEERRAKAEQERMRVAAQIADIDQRIADVTATATAEIDGYAEAAKDATDQSVYFNMAVERREQMLTQLVPLETERNRLLGIEATMQANTNAETDASVAITGRASEAIRAYNEALEAVRKQQAGVEAMYPPLNAAVEGSTEVFSRAASAANRSFGSILLSAQEHLGQLPRVIPRYVDRTFSRMFGTLDDAKAPWKEAFKNLARWAKDPFEPDKFEKWMNRQARKFIQRAQQAMEDGQPGVARRSRAIARAIRNPIVRSLVDIGMRADDAVMALLSVQRAGRIINTLGGNIRDAVGSIFDNNATGTRSYRGGMTWVGEDGPELLRLPSGSSVTSSGQSMMSGAGGGGSNYTINVNVAPGADMVQTGRQIVEAIRQYERRSGALWRAA